MNMEKSSRSPKCSRCRNHGFTADRKGHSGKCAFLDCTCWKCSLITERTRIMANHRRMRRTAPAHSAAAAAPARPTTGTDTEPERRPAEPAAYRSSRDSAGVYDPAPYFTPDAPQQIPYSDKMLTMPLLLGYQHPDGFVYPAFLVNLQQPPPGEAIGFPPPPPSVPTYPAEPRQPQEGPVSFSAPRPPYPFVLEESGSRLNYYNMNENGTNNRPSQPEREAVVVQGSHGRDADADGGL